MVFPGLDLKHAAASICNPARNSLAGDIDALGQAGVRANHATFSADDVSSLCGALWRGAQGQELFLSRSVPVYGLRPADLSREPARHRGVFACPGEQALPHGDSQSDIAQHASISRRLSR